MYMYLVFKKLPSGKIKCVLVTLQGNKFVVTNTTDTKASDTSITYSAFKTACEEGDPVLLKSVDDAFKRAEALEGSVAKTYVRKLKPGDKTPPGATVITTTVIIMPK